MDDFTRRGLIAGASVAAASALPAEAAAPPKGKQAPSVYRYKIGSFEVTALKDNLNALIADLQKAKPPSSKGQYLKRVTLSSTMGPGVVVDQASLAF